MKRFLFSYLLAALLPLSISAYQGDSEEILSYPKKTYVGYRDYSKTLTSFEFADIHFIIKTMATKSLTSLLKYKSALNDAGDRVDHVHPLKFLLAIFKDEELKVHMHNLKKRGGMVWSEFYKGLKGSLQEELDLGNLTDDMIDDFSYTLDLDSALISDDIKKEHWDVFIKTLIVKIPREGDSGRYDQ